MKSSKRVLLSVVFSGTMIVAAQQPTIHELIADHPGETELTTFVTAPSGRPPTVNELLDHTDAIVRGVVGKPTSYISDDETSVLTDYPIVNAAVLYEEEAASLAKPGMTPSVVVTLHGGTVRVGGVSYTEKQMILPTLEPGQECVFLLTRRDNKYFVVHGVGAFAVQDDQLVALSAKEGFAPEYKNAPASETVADMVARAQSRRR